MKSSLTESSRLRRNRRGLLGTLVIATVIGLVAGPALADDNRDRDRGHDQHRDREVHRGPPPRMHEDYRAYDNNGGYVYAPPAVVYAPYAPPALDFVFPIEIR
jgi:hypothetical protein